MTLLYFSLFLMTLIAAGFIGRRSLALVLILISLGTYNYFIKTEGLAYWLKGGEEHYQLMVKFNELGGIDGIIQQVKKKLALNPNDKQGQEILLKLYKMKKGQE